MRTDLARVRSKNPGARVPVDLVTAAGSGLDPHITLAAAEFQVPRVARVRGMAEVALWKLVLNETEGRQFGVLGEPRVNVLRLNRLLDDRYPLRARSTAANR